MMDCRHVKSLLPLWIGQDLPDAVTMNDVARHLEQCPECSQRRNELQQSLDALQGCSAELLVSGAARRSVLPELTSRIIEWESRRKRERFNGWIPATVMALAVALMVAVSLPSIHEVFSDGESTAATSMDLFETTPDFGLPGERKINRPGIAPQISRGTPVNYTPDQW